MGHILGSDAVPEMPEIGIEVPLTKPTKAWCSSLQTPRRCDGRRPAARLAQIVRDVLKQHQVELMAYVPDNVLRPLIEGVHADPFFAAFTCAREEEAVGIVSAPGWAACAASC